MNRRKFFAATAAVAGATALPAVAATLPAGKLGRSVLALDGFEKISPDVSVTTKSGGPVYAPNLYFAAATLEGLKEKIGKAGKGHLKATQDHFRAPTRCFLHVYREPEQESDGVWHAAVSLFGVKASDFEGFIQHS